MNIEELTVKQARELAKLFGAGALPDHPYEVGANYFIRTVTYHLTGRLKAVFADELVITNAAWIADSGRFAQAMATGVFSEVEPWPDGMDVIVNRESITDCSKAYWPLPRVQK